jgi:hypothetical protein
MTNLKFKAIRKSHGFEWEAYRNIKTRTFIAICHAFSGSVESNTWDDLWEKIMEASKKQRDNKRGGNKAFS